VTFSSSRFGRKPIPDDDHEEPSVSDRRRSAAPVAPGPEPAQGTRRADAEILEALSRSETRLALELCIARYGQSIGRLCMAMLGSQRDADEVTQQTLLVAHQRFAEVVGAASLHAWLLSIARHECLLHLERNRRRTAPASQPPDAEGDGDGSAAVQRRKERGAAARALLERARPGDREALLLRFGADLSFEEVATATGVDERTARQRVSRALLRLRSALGSDHDDD
jgi:RNA polymerase sigma-70 factor, ECF subfamily